MFSSPTPRTAPRKSVYRPSGSVLRNGTAGGTPSAASERGRDPQTPTRGPRLKALRGASPARSVGGDSVRTMGGGAPVSRYESESHERQMLGKDARMGLASLGGLPREVNEVLRRSGHSGAVVEGHVDIASGYAFVTTDEHCFAWNFAKASPTVYTFPAPPPIEGEYYSQSGLFASLHHSGSPEPGIILVSSEGRIHLWEALGAALASVDRYQYAECQLGPEEQVERICAIDSSSYLITTNQSRIFRLSIISQGGRLTPTVAPLLRSTGMFSRASPVLFGAEEDRQGVSCIAVHGKEVWVVARKTAQKWSFTDAAKLVQEQDIHDLIGKEAFAEKWNSGDIELQICDMVHAGSNRFAVTVSYVNRVSTSAAGRTYALIMLSTAARSGLLVVESSSSLGYQPTIRSGPEAPRVQMHDMLAFIQFRDVVVTLDTSPASRSEDLIALKNPSSNRFIGSSMDTLKRAKQTSVDVSLVFMPAEGGLIGVELYKSSIMLERKSEEVQATEKLKSRMQQAVFYGDNARNPLSFDVLGIVDGADVDVAAEQLSHEILSCTSPHMPGIPQIHAMLNDRLQRLRLVIEYIIDNDLMQRLSQTARRKLSRDAEKAKAALELWTLQDKLMSEGHAIDTASNLLSVSIVMLMRQYGDMEGDVVRQFFRTHVEHIDELLSIVFNNYTDATSGSMPLAQRTSWVYEANQILAKVIRTSNRYAEGESARYQVDPDLITITAWTSSTSILHALEALYAATTKVLSDRTRELGTAVDQGISMADGPEMRQEKHVQEELRNHLTILAPAILASASDRLNVVSHLSESDPQRGPECDEAIRKFDAVRPDVIRPLVEFDRVDCAYELAERYKDFQTLVWLCHLDLPRAKKDAKQGVVRVEQYIERHGREFAFVLYQWYIDEHQEHALLSQVEQYADYVTQFFQQYGYNELAWLHHLACRRFGHTAGALDAFRSDIPAQQERTLLDSIGKLAAVADLRLNGAASLGQDLLPKFDKDLGSLQVQKALQTRISTSVGRRTGNKVQHYLNTCSANLDTRPAFKALFTQLVEQVYSGTCLDTEGLVDVLTMKENKGDGAGDAAEALIRLAYDLDLASGRKEVALLSAWRRVFIQDDWAMINNTTGRSEAAQRKMLMGTAAFATIHALQAKGDTDQALPPAFFLPPFSATGQPQTAELSARFPEKTPAEIASLMADYENEIELLERYIGECNIDQRVKEVSALVDEVMGAAAPTSIPGEVEGVGEEAKGEEGEESEYAEGDVEM